MGMAASKERGKHERDDFPQQLLLSAQAAFDLGHQGSGEIQVLQGLMEGLDILLGLRALVLETRLGFKLTAFSGFGLFVGGIHVKRDNRRSIAYSEELIFPIASPL